jgi:hypothetical protein
MKTPRFSAVSGAADKVLGVVEELVGEIILPDAAAGITVGPVTGAEEGEGGFGDGFCLGAGGEGDGGGDREEWADHGVTRLMGVWGSLG